MGSVFQRLTLALLLGVDTAAQQFSDWQWAIDYPGISQGCAQALNTTISCDTALSWVAQQNGALLNATTLDSLCSSSCRTSLDGARSTILNACAASTDVLVLYADNIAYPATYIIDSLIYAYGISCRRDRSTDAFCDEFFLEWQLEGGTMTSAQNCSDCFLGVESMELSSPFGYDDGLASNFQSMTSSCGATGYAFSSPTNIALNGTATATAPQSGSATATQSCTSTYVLSAGDDCNSVALANKVSTGNLMLANNLNINCEDFPPIGTSLCIPAQCNVYTLKNNDTCLDIIAQQAGVTFSQLLSWNPNIDSVCGNLGDLVGTVICISPPGGSYNPEVTSDPAVSIPSTATAVPTNARDGSNRQCGRWYTVQDGDDCSLVTTANYISLSDFYFLNPNINANCTNLLLGIAYCVEAVGAISTYSGYPTTSNWITLPPQTTRTFTTPTSTPLPPYTGTVSSEVQLPTASGTVSNCTTYQNYKDVDYLYGGVSVSRLNSCNYIAYLTGVQVVDLMAWNPSLSSNVSSCELQPGFSYCVGVSDGEVTTGGTAPGCEQIVSSVEGTIDTCVCYSTYHGYENETLTCDALAADYDVTVVQLKTWNSWIGSGDCNQGLFANLTYYGERAVCIGVNSTVPTNTASTPPTNSPTSTGTGAPGPTQSGIVTGCTQYYTVQSGDSCAAIEGQFAISFEQFYAWNPAVGSNCEALWVGYAYCVAGPVSSTTSTAGAPAPTQSGIAPNCNQYYTVQSGDSCDKIEKQYSLTFQELYTWNPAIGDDCQSLWVGYALCVGVSA